VVGIPLCRFTELYGKACIADVSAEINDDEFDASEALTRISHHPSRQLLRNVGPLHCSTSGTPDRCIPAVVLRRRYAEVALIFFDTVDIYVEYLEFDNEVNSSLLGTGINLDLF
jgi:hypothetical protein